MGEGEVGVDGETDRQVGVEFLELAEQVADGQILRQGKLREQWGQGRNQRGARGGPSSARPVVRRSARGVGDEGGEKSGDSLGRGVDAELLDPYLAVGGQHLDAPDNLARPGGGSSGSQPT